MGQLWTDILAGAGGLASLLGGNGAAANGYGYIIGGYDGSNTLKAVWKYDPTGDSWTQDTNYPIVMRLGTGQAINNVIYVATGYSGGATTSGYAGSEDAPPVTFQPFIMWY